MTQRHAIELALDLARMPALARSNIVPPIPPNVVVLMRIAALSPNDCQEAAAATGEPARIVIEAAQFYLQQLLFRPDADCYRILGIQPGVSRATARSHMRWLLQWVHPDRNSGLDAVYAERVLKAWREVSGSGGIAARPERSRTASMRNGTASGSFRLPWIKHPVHHPRLNGQGVSRLSTWVMPASLLGVFLTLLSVLYYFGYEQTAAMIRLP